MHQYMNCMSSWLLMCGPPPMHSLMETWVSLYDSVFVCQSSYFCCHTLFWMCTCISTWIYVLPYTPCLVHPVRIVTWKVGWPCVSLHVCPCHHIFVPTPCLECVHASVHEFMSSWLLMCGPPPMHSLMETWVPLYGSVFDVPVISFQCSTSCLVCGHASVHEFMSILTPHEFMSGPLVLWIVTWKVGWPCVSLHVCPSHLIFVPTPCLECVQASVHEFMSSWLLMCGPPPIHSLMETWVSLYDSVFVWQSSYVCCLYTLFRMCTCISTWIYVYLTPHVMVHPIWIVTW